jgi:hypothetical protein
MGGDIWQEPLDSGAELHEYVTAALAQQGRE